ncbi:hypothetical protein M0R45_002601 [Rubus argutus]|uniref:non-specific serine/threonine protein kinase n=1 Tax=Rubus argutus TaxID=59490 RepID=A0AAW1VNA6_RUBAR
MSTEARLVSKHMILYLILTLCHLGSEFKSQCIAQKLPVEEARALYAFTNELSSLLPIISDYTQVSCNGRKLVSNIQGYDNIGTCNCKFQNGTTCHITKVDLSMNQLTGSIPISLGNLSSLSILDLSSNKLTGSIPESLGNMKFQVKLLGPSSRKVDPSGKRTMSVTFQLDLVDNQLSGSIPTTLGNVAVSSMTSDADAYRLFKLKQYDKASLESNFGIYLSRNQLIGPIPESFGNLTFVTDIFLNDNFLNGSIPTSLGALTYLNDLELYNNEISGTLPQTLGNVTALTYFGVDSNSITGTLPTSFASLTNMMGFYVAANQLSGSIPDFIANWTSINGLSFSGNNFHRNIPAIIFNFSNLAYLDISDVDGSHFRFPQSTNSFGLVYLDLSINNLIGGIPDSLQKLNLSYTSFSNNMLTGAIPDWILNWNVTDLSYNNFSKLTFKPSPKTLVNLFACCCNSSTCVPQTIYPSGIMKKHCPRGKPNYHSLFINCGGEEITNIDKNCGGEKIKDIDGNVYEKDNDTSQFYLSPKGNWARSSAGDIIHSVKCGLSNEEPLYDKARSSPVSLKYYGFCLRNGNYRVTLHFAEIVENKNYTTRKRRFDVYIQGKRKLKDFNIIDKVGGPNKVHTENFTAVNVNNSTLLIHFYSAGDIYLENGPLISAISVTPEYKLRKQLSPLNIALIIVASNIVFLLLLLLFAWLMGWLGNADHLQEIDIGLEKAVTLKQLKDATRNFSERNEISQGGFGTVYKAELQGKTVAVKRLSSPSEERINELKNEFYTLKSMSHQNLVQLLDVYNAKGLHLLIYEYMQNNSLAHALFDSKSKLKLDWEARFNICLGIARGLVYLHEHPRLKIVHRDIKSANILLDGDLKPKISDFGLASLYTEDDQFKFIKVEVPQGYMSPEYVRGIVTSKADVYSFGVVILETVSGRTNAGYMRDSQETEFLLDTAYDLHRKGRLVDLVDKKLSAKYDAKQAIIILNLAVKCTSISPTLRPTMSQVVSVLVGEKKIEEICPPAQNDNQIAQIDSSASIEVTSRASTSSNYYIKGEDEIEHISESTP